MTETGIGKFGIVLAFILFFSFSAVVPAVADQDVRPGLTNPVMNPTRWTLFRDDEAVTFVENLSKDSQNLFSQSMTPASDNLTDWNTEQSTGNTAHKIYGTDYERFSLATGRVTATDHDQTVRAYIGSGTDAVVEVFNEDKEIVWTKRFNDPQDDAWYSRVRVAVGDLDFEKDEDGNYHDEIAVARLYKQAGGYVEAVTILDYEMNELASKTATHHKEIWDIRLEIGDFDGDDLLELAVVNNYHDWEFSYAGYRYDPDSNLLTRSSQVSYNGHGDQYGADTAAGDFDGDGKDELVLYNYTLTFFQADENMVFSKKHETDRIHDVDQDPYAKLVSGLFYMDPDNGYGINRRQLALAIGYSYNDYVEDDWSYGLTVSVYRIDDNFGLKYIGEESISGLAHPQISNEYEGFDLTAGNFIGHQNNNEAPVMQLALSYIEISPPSVDSNNRFTSNAKKESKVSIFKLAEPHLLNIHTISGQSFDSGQLYGTEWKDTLPNLATSIAAVDLDGDTYRLGAPVHISFQNLVSLDAIIQEPPKHVDYLPSDPGEWDGPWKVINVSAYPQHHVALESESETEKESKTTSTTDWAIGGSVAVSAEHSVETEFGPLKGSITYQGKVKIKRDYDEHKKEYESEYHSLSTSISAETAEDDILYGSYQNIDIWRYAVIGAKSDEGLNIFQDIIIPGAKHSFSGGGLKHMDWYAPVHQNRNLLSYPDMEDGFPQDVGEFTVLDNTKKEVMTPDLTFNYDGNPHEMNISWTDSAGSGSEKEWKNTCKESVDLSIAYTSDEDTVAIKYETKSKLAINFNNENSWGGSETSSTTSSSGKAVTVVIPDIQLPGPGWSYSYKPTVYVSDGGGALKCAHGVDLENIADNGFRWANYYGGRPDPGLSLPYRFTYYRDEEFAFGAWELVEDESRMIMRGLFMYHEKNDPIADKPLLYAESPTDGDQVRLRVRVYNFSINQTVTNVPVKFEYALIDTSNHMELENAGRTLIGETTIDELTPLGMKEAAVTWDTTGLSTIRNPETGEMDPNLALRLYVVLDTDNVVPDEIHEYKDLARTGEDGWTDEHGRLYHGNNEGFYPDSGGIFIHPKDAPAEDDPEIEIALMAGIGQSKAENMDTKLNMHEDSLGIDVPGKGILTKGEITVTKGETYKLRAHIVADNLGTKHRPLLFHDRHPDDTDEVIDMATIRGTRSDNYVWGRWTPDETGQYELWTVLLDSASEANGGVTSDILYVNVVAADESDNDCDDTCFIETICK